MNSITTTGRMRKEVALAGTSLELKVGDIVNLIAAVNQPGYMLNFQIIKWFAKPVNGIWSDGIDHNEDDSILIGLDDIESSTKTPIADKMRKQSQVKSCTFFGWDKMAAQLHIATEVAAARDKLGKALDALSSYEGRPPYGPLSDEAKQYAKEAGITGEQLEWLQGMKETKPLPDEDTSAIDDPDEDMFRNVDLAQVCADVGGNIIEPLLRVMLIEAHKMLDGAQVEQSKFDEIKILIEMIRRAGRGLA